MECIITAANILEVSEYEILRQGFSEWFGQQPDAAELEFRYRQYLRTGRPPFWASRYAHHVIAAFEATEPAGGFGQRHGEFQAPPALPCGRYFLA